MKPIANRTKATDRRTEILYAARWCFLNFGFAKTSMEEIAKRAGIARTLIYRFFKDKGDIYKAVFAHWLSSRHPLARQAVKGHGNPYERLLNVCKVMVIEPYSDMVGAPMGSEFSNVCGRLDPEMDAKHRRVALECSAEIIGDKEAAEIFLLSLDGLLSDTPTVALLEKRIMLLAARFVKPV